MLWLFTAPIATHLGAELVERYGAEHREPLAEHLERHPDHSLAALAPDPGITFGSVLFSLPVISPSPSVPSLPLVTRRAKFNFYLNARKVAARGLGTRMRHPC